MTSVALVGDIFLQESLPDSAQLAEVRSLLEAADIAFGNLEAPLSNRGVPTEKWVNMRMAPALFDEIKALGFNALNLANNHMMDYGEAAFVDTMSNMILNDMNYVGVGLDIEQAWMPKVIDAGGFQVALLGAASTLGPGLAAGPDRPGVAPIHVSESYHIDPAASMEQPGSAPYVFTRAYAEDLERAVAAVDDIRRDADFVIMALHWGVPPFWRPRFQDGLADYQIEVGRALIDAGVDVIAGHHPHSLQEVEIYRGKPIFYSLGNFVFHHNRGPDLDTSVSRNAPYAMTSARRDREWSETVIVLMQIDDDGGVSYALQPALLDDAGNPSLLHGGEARALIERLSAISPNASLEYSDGLGYLTLSQSVR